MRNGKGGDVVLCALDRVESRVVYRQLAVESAWLESVGSQNAMRPRLLIQQWLLCMMATSVLAQQVAVETPLQGVSDRFHEQVHIGWGYESGNFSFQWPGGLNQQPSVGGVQGGAVIGGAINGPGRGRGRFRLSLDQGSTRSRSVIAPTVVVPNGGYGSFTDVVYRPFVIGWTPVVGQAPAVAPLQSWSPFGGFTLPTGTAEVTYLHPLHERLQRLATEPPAAKPTRAKPPQVASNDPLPPPVSSADQADLSVAEIRARQAEADRQRAVEVRQIVQDARHDVQQGKLYLARSKVFRARRHAPAQLQEPLENEWRRIDRLIQIDQARRRGESKSDPTGVHSARDPSPAAVGGELR